MHRNRYIEWTEKDEYRNNLKVISDMINGLCEDVPGYRGNIKNYRLPLRYNMRVNNFTGGFYIDDEIDEYVRNGEWGVLVSRYNHILKTDSEIDAYEVDGDEVFRLPAGRSGSNYQSVEIFCHTNEDAYNSGGL